MSWTTKSHELLTVQAQQLAAILSETDFSAPAIQEKRYIGSNGGDHLKLRGIPAIGRSVTGAIPGTIPHTIR